jgi:CRISPR-associated protein Csm4
MGREIKNSRLGSDKVNYYIIKLKPKSFFSRIPSSYTIFGTICWGLKDLYNIDLKEYIGDFINNPEFIISEVFLYDKFNNKYLLPKPLDLEFDIDLNDDFEKKYANNAELKNYFYNEFRDDFDEELENKAFRLFLINKLKKFKKEKYISYEDFFNYIEGEINAENIFKKYILDEMNNKIKTKEENSSKPKIIKFDVQRNSIDRMTLSVNEDSGGTFYEHLIALKQYDLYFILKTSNIDRLIPVLNFIFDRGIGKKKSVGRGQFDIEIAEDKSAKNFIQKIENNNKEFYDYKITLSKYIPSEGDMELENNTYYELESFRGITEDRDYFFGKNIFKAKVNYIKEGSILKVKKNKEIYGQIPIVKYIDDKEIYHYGLGFFLNFKKVKK